MQMIGKTNIYIHYRSCYDFNRDTKHLVLNIDYKIFTEVMGMTRTMVLGLLQTFGQMSGYEIQQKMQLSQTDKWAYVKPASIYHALKKMEKEGLVVLETIEQTGNRSKAIYNITLEGKKELERLVIKSFKESSVIFPAKLYTALTFMNESTKEEILNALEEQKQTIQNIYEEMKAGQKEKENYSDIPENVMMIFTNMYEQCELQLNFIKQINEKLLSQKKK